MKEEKPDDERLEITYESRSVRDVPVIAYLGPEATFSHQAAMSFYGKSASFREAKTIEDVFDLVEKGVCHQGIVPIENSYEGSVNITLDLFYKHELRICAELFMRIRHHLLSRTKKIAGIKRIYSHPMPIAQCRLWIKNNMQGIPVTEVASSAAAVKMASKETEAAAIGSRLSSQTYGLDIVKENIEDQGENITRFLVIGKYLPEPTGNDKTSLLFILHHRPGALHRALSSLADRRINMCRIESRPMKIKNWEYMFFVDIEGHEQESNISKALEEMGKNCIFMKRLGSYPAGGDPRDD